MSIAFVYALGLLLVIPYLAGWEALGWVGMTVGILGAWIVIGIAKCCESGKEEDEEILGTYVTEARYYEPWTEKIKHEDEETGEVTYEEVEHDEEWEITVAEGDIFDIDEDEYEEFVSLFGNEEEEEADHYGEAEGEIIDPGYCYTTTWPGTFETASYEYVYRSYKNPLLRTDNVYTDEKLDEKTIKTYHLETYGRKGLYGQVKGEDVEALEDEIRDYNCWMREKNIKLNFILLENEKSSRAMLWQQYWHNGKRNTINAVVGVDSKHKIQWAHVFGWQNEAACIKLRNFITGQEVLSDITTHISQVWDILNGNYHLPDFKQYDFVQGHFPLKGTLIALTICIGLFCGLFCRPVQYNHRAYRHIEQGSYQQAKNELHRHLQQHPEDGIALNDLGVLYFRDKQFEEAEKFLNRAVEQAEQLASDSAANVYRNRGTLYRETNRKKQAIADYKKSIETYSYATKSYCVLYRLYTDLGYKKSRWALQEKYNDYIFGSLKEDCRDDEDQVTFMFEEVDFMKDRGIVKLINEIFNNI